MAANSSPVQLLSRNSRDLGPWFPELVQAGQQLPVGTLIDGEILIADDKGCTDSRPSRFGRALPATARHTWLQVVEQRDDVDLAQDWLVLLPSRGGWWPSALIAGTPLGAETG